MFGSFLAVLGYNVLAFLDISGVHDNIIFLMTSLVIICLALSVILDIIGGTGSAHGSGTAPGAAWATPANRRAAQSLNIFLENIFPPSLVSRS